MPRLSLDEIFSDTKPSLDEIFQSKTPIDYGIETAKKTFRETPLFGFSPRQLETGQRTMGEVIERPVAGLRGIAKEGLPGFKKGLLQPEKYPPGTFAETYQETFPKMSPVISGILGTIADAGYYFGVPEAATRIATAGKVKLLENTIKNVDEVLRSVGRKDIQNIPKATLNKITETVAKNKDVGTILDAYIKSKNIKTPPGLLEFKKPTTTPPKLLGFIDTSSDIISADRILTKQFMKGIRDVSLVNDEAALKLYDNYKNITKNIIPFEKFKSKGLSDIQQEIKSAAPITGKKLETFQRDIKLPSPTEKSLPTMRPTLPQIFEQPTLNRKIEFPQKPISAKERTELARGKEERLEELSDGAFLGQDENAFYYVKRADGTYLKNPKPMLPDKEGKPSEQPNEFSFLDDDEAVEAYRVSEAKLGEDRIEKQTIGNLFSSKPTAGFALTKTFQPSEWVNALDDIWYKSVGKKLETNFFGLLNKITPEVVKRNIVEAYGQPISYQKLVDMLNADRANNAGMIKDISLKISQFKPEEIKNIRQYIETGNYPDTPIGKTAREIEDIFFDLGKQLVRYGLLKPSQFAKYADKYFPHYYKIFEKDGSVTRWFRKRLDLSYAKHRKDVPEEMKEAMGIIDDSPAPVAKKMISEMADISLQRFFETISQNPELSSKTPTGKFKQLPKNPKLGFLSEMYVDPSIADDLQGMVYVPQLADGIMTKMLSLWKTGKVVLNPPTVGRNILTNFFMADIVGRVPMEDIGAWIQGATSLRNKDKYYQLLKNQGKIGVEFYRGEIEDILNTFPSQKNPVNVALSILKKGGDYYSALEEWAKVTIFRKNVLDGKSVEESAQLAEDAIFNYSKVAPLIRQLRQGRGQGPLGMAGTILSSPFITFKAKAIKALSHAAFKRPFSLLKYMLLFSAIGAMSKKVLDISDEKYKEMQSSLAERGRYGLLTPLKDEDNSYYMLDLTFMLPIIGDYLEMKSVTSKKGILSGLQRATGLFGNPFINIPAQALANKDFYSQREIYNELDLPIERFRKQIEFIYQQSVPPLAPFGGGYQLLEKQELPKKLLSLSGLRLLRYNEDEEIEIQLRQIKNTEFQFNMEKRRLLKNDRLSESQKEKKFDLLLKGYERKKELLLK